MKWQRHGCLLVACLAPAAGLALTAAVRAGEIRIWPTAVVTDDVVTLADVADLRGFDFPIRHKLGALVVHSAPRPGGEVVVGISDVRGALAESQANLASINMLGSARCKVSRPRMPRVPRVARAKHKPPPKRRTRTDPTERVRSKPSVPAAETLASALHRYISARVAEPSAKLEVRFGSTGEQALALKAEDHDFGIRPADDRQLGLLSFEVDITPRDGRPPYTEPIVAEVQLVKEVVVARRTINRGRIIEGRDLKLEARRFMEAESVGITDLAAAVGRQCAQFVSSGQALHAEMLRSRPLVRRGERVTVWVRHGGVEINTSGTAQQPGALGELIEVQRDGAKRKQDLIEAIVTGPGTVTVSDAREPARR